MFSAGLIQAETKKVDPEKIEQKVVCQCGCNMPLNTCVCDFAANMRAEIQELVQKYGDEEKVMEALVAKYGPMVKAEPPKSGFGFSAWITPFFMILVGGGLIFGYLYYGRKKRTEALPHEEPGAEQKSEGGEPQSDLDELRKMLMELDK